MRKLLFSALLLSCTEVNAEAACSSILTHGLRNIAIDQSDSALIAAKYEKNCGSDYSSKSDSQLIQAEAEIFGYGSGSGSYNRARSEEKLKTWCDKHENSLNRSSSSLSRSETFYQGAVDAWNRCIELNKQNLNFTPTISADRKTVDIGIVFTSNTKSGISFYGLVFEGFSCSAKSPSGEIDFPYELKNEYVSINCRRNETEKRVIGEQEYDVLGRGTITIQTAGKPIQLFFPEEYYPAAPTKEITRLSRKIEDRDLPVGTLISSTLSEEEFYSQDNSSHMKSIWVLADGRSVQGSEYQRITGNENVPDLNYLKESFAVQSIKSLSVNSGDNVNNIEVKDAENWAWFVSGKNISGNRFNGDYEQDEDQKQTYITEDGTVVARGRTLNHKHNRWGDWKNGSANLLGLGFTPYKLNFYVKVN